jgi:hypothetical protein
MASVPPVHSVRYLANVRRCPSTTRGGGEPVEVLDPEYVAITVCALWFQGCDFAHVIVYAETI